MGRVRDWWAVNGGFVIDAAERVGWTALQAALGVVIVVLGDLEIAWAPVIAAGLSAVKAQVAKRVGDPQSAATLPD